MMSPRKKLMTDFNWIEGSVTAPAGFRASGIAAGIKPSGAPDLALVASDRPGSSAAIFTCNVITAAPVKWSRALPPHCRAAVINAGNANCCTGEQGMRDAARMAELAATALDLSPQEVIVASTGVIGRPMPMSRLETGIPSAAASLSAAGGPAAARAIMTTDTCPKEAAVECDEGRAKFRVGGICKGSGMIHPQMATMLALVTTDLALQPDLLNDLLRRVADRTFNRVTVDGDTSTNDMLAVLSNGASGLEAAAGSPLQIRFEQALEAVCSRLARMLARDGEGATRLVQVRVTGTADGAAADRIARTVANSPLVKTAVFGNDPNWGRILMAAGRAGVAFREQDVSLTLCGIPLFRRGEPAPFDAAAASAAMKVDELPIDLCVGEGAGEATVWTCDFSYDYVRINAEYTT